MTDKKFLVFGDKGLMIFDHIFRQFDGDTLGELVVGIYFSIVLDDGNLFCGIVVVWQVDVVGGDGMPVEQSLGSVPEVSLNDGLVDEIIIVNDESDHHAETVGWWNENVNFLIISSIGHHFDLLEETASQKYFLDIG